MRKQAKLTEFGLRLDGRSLLNINFRAPFNNNNRASPGRSQAIYMRCSRERLFKLYLNLTVTVREPSAPPSGVMNRAPPST